MAYFRVAFLAKQSTILEGDRELLQQMEQAAQVRYRSGMGNQQEVHQAQLELTKLLREVTGTGWKSASFKRN
jgi:outer membrane protein TolC